MADKLATSRALKVNLSSTSTTYFDGSTDATDIGVDGILSKNNGGTGNNLGYIQTGKLSSSIAGENATIEGLNNIATGNCSHTEGRDNTSEGDCSHAEGCGTKANGYYSHSQGYYTIAKNYQSVLGICNVETDSPNSVSDKKGSLFVIGSGNDASMRRNIFRISTDGEVYWNGAYNTSGADYAEYFEWNDANSNGEDRIGLFVTLKGDKIRIANESDTYILGIISGNPSIVGNSYFGDKWHNMYLKDTYGRLLQEEVFVEETIDNLGEIIPAHTEIRNILNPDYKSDEKYIPRELRKEWDAVGLLGKLIVIDDGSCVVNSYCKVSKNGIATASDKGYRVTNRINENNISIIFR